LQSGWHPHKFKRANRQLKRLRTMLGAVTRDITRKLAGRPELTFAFALPLSLARRVKDQRQRGRKVYSLHAPEVECIGKGKAHKPYEFGVKVSVATTLERSRGGQFVTHVKAMPGNPYDGHTLETVVPAIEQTIGVTLARIVADAGYRGHTAPKDKMFKVHIAGYKRGLTKAVKRALRRRAAVEPVIGHLKQDHRMGRNFLAHAEGDANNAVLAAVGYNFSLLLNWLRLLLWAFFLARLETLTVPYRDRDPHDRRQARLTPPASPQAAEEPLSSRATKNTRAIEPDVTWGVSLAYTVSIHVPGSLSPSSESIERSPIFGSTTSCHGTSWHERTSAARLHCTGS